MKLIDRGIFQQPNGIWWAWSNVKPDRASSLHTRDRAAAQAKYDEQLRRLRRLRVAVAAEC